MGIKPNSYDKLYLQFSVSLYPFALRVLEHLKEPTKHSDLTKLDGSTIFNKQLDNSTKAGIVTHLYATRFITLDKEGRYKLNTKTETSFKQKEPKALEVLVST